MFNAIQRALPGLFPFLFQLQSASIGGVISKTKKKEAHLLALELQKNAKLSLELFILSYRYSTWQYHDHHSHYDSTFPRPPSIT